MNFQILKQGFLVYLQEKMAQENNSSENSVQDLQEISIFSHKDEFEDYLKEEVGIDMSEFSGDIGDILSLEFKEGQFQTENDSKNGFYAEFLNDAFNNEDLKVALDSDKNGSLNKGEATSFVKSLEDDKGQISVEKIFSATSEKIEKNEKVSKDENANETEETKEGYSLDFIGSAASGLSSSEQQLVGKLLDTDGDGKLSEKEQGKVESLLGVLDGKKGDLTKKDFDVLKDYISSLKDFKMTDDEIINSIKGLDGNADDLTVKDFKKMANSIEDGSLLDSLEEASQEGIEPNSAMEASGGGNESPGSGASAPANAEKTVENMSIEELEAALKDSDSKIKESEDKYMKELEKADKELHDKIKQANDKIKIANENIQNANSQIAQYQTRSGEIDSEISGLQGQLADANEANKSIETKKGSDPNAKKIDTDAIQAKIDKLQKEKDDIEQNKIPELKGQIEGFESEITGYKAEISGYEAEVSALGENHPDLKSTHEEYKAAVAEKDNIKSTLEKRKADQAKEEESDRPDKTEGSKDYRDKEGLDFKNLPMSYTLDGKEYHCVGFEGYDLDGDGSVDFKPDSWEEVQRYFKNGGVENLGAFGSMQCHNYSDMLGQFCLGDVNLDFVKALYNEMNDPSFGNQDKAGYMGTSKEWNPRRFAQCKAVDRDAERAIIENELQNGRPVLVSIPTSSGSHWGTAVGISDDGDILIWDSYNGSMKKLGRSSNSDQNKEHRNLASANGVMVFCSDYSYQYGTYSCIDYWKYVEQGPEYIRQNGYRK